MPNPERSIRRFTISAKNRALLASALLALGAGGGIVRAQVDLGILRSRAEQGDPEALNALGNAYANGQGVAQSFSDALRLYQQAADRGLAAAQFNLGMMHELGRGVAPDLATAFRFYLKSAEQGFAPAQFNVGNMYANGLGVRQDYFEAALWFRQAADRGVPEAQYNLALAYELGRGVVKDEPAAQRWYRQSAGQRYARAQYNLALMLEEGRGSAPDPVAAVELYRAAAAQNFAPAQNNLGILLAEGRGAPPNLVEAYAWLALAVENGAKPTGRDIVAQQLSSPQLAEATATVAKLRSQLGLREPTPAAVPSARPPAPVAAAASPVPGTPPPEIVALNQRVIAAESELERLRGENARLSGAEQALAREKAALEQRLAAATTAASAARSDQSERDRVAQQLAGLQSALAEARDASTRLAAENNQLKASLSGVQTAVAAETRARTEALTEIERLRTESARLAEAAASRPAADDTAALRAQVQQLTREKAEAEQTAAALGQQLAAARATVSAASAAPSSPGAKAVTDARVAQLLADNERLNEDVKRSTIELARLSRDLRLAQQASGKSGASTPASPGPAVEDSAKLDALTRQIAELRAANETLSTENRRLAATSGGAGDRERLAQQLAAAQSDVARLRSENDGLQRAASTAGELPAARQRIAAAEQALAEATRQRDALTAEKNALAKRVTDLEARPVADPGALQQLRAQLGEALDELGAARQAGTALQTQLEQAKQALVAAESERTRASTSPAQQEAVARISGLEEQLAAARQQLSAQEAALAETRRDREQLAAQLTEAGRAQAAGELAAQQLAGVTAERDRLGLILNERELERAAAEELRTQLEAANRTIADLNARTASQERDFDLVKRGAAAALAVVEKTAAELRGERDDLAGRLAAAERSMAAGDAAAQKLAEVTPRLTQATQQLAAVTAERDRLGAALRERSTEAQAAEGLRTQIESASRTIAELSGKNDSLQKDLEVAKQTAAAALAAQAAAERSMAAGDAAAQKLAEVTPRLAQVTQQLAAVTAERDRLGAALQERSTEAQAAEGLRTQIESASRTIAELSGKNDSLQKDLEVAKQTVAAALAAQAAAVKAAPTDAMRLEMATLQSQVRAYETRLDDERRNTANEISSLATQLQTSREAFRSLTEANRTLLQSRGAEEAALKAELDQVNSRLNTVLADLEKARTEQGRLAAEIEARSREVESVRAAARAESAALQARYAETLKAVETHGSSVAELTGLNQKLTAEKSGLEQQLAKALQGTEAVRNELNALQSRMAAADKTAREQQVSLSDLGEANERLKAQTRELGGQIVALRAENTRLSSEAEALGNVRGEVADLKARLADAVKASGVHGSSVAELTGANEKLSNELKDLQAQLVALRADNARLAQGDAARQEAEQRAASYAAAAAQLTSAQRDLASARAEIAQLNDTVQVIERDRTARISQLQRENTAIAARLQQAQGTLDQIASAARFMNTGSGGVAALPPSAPTLPSGVGSSNVVTPVTPAPRMHTVAEGETLTRISVRYYGTSNRWQDIYEANREVLKGENTLRPGQRLRIP